MEDLKATQVVLQNNREEGTICMLAKAQGQVWLRACRVVMTYKIQSLCTAHIFQVAGF